MKPIGRALLELGDQVEVEGACLVTLGVDQQAPASDRLSDEQPPSDDITQEASAEAHPFVSSIDAQSSQQGDWLGAAPGTLGEPRRGISHIELGHRPGVVRNNPATVIVGPNWTLAVVALVRTCRLARSISTSSMAC